MMVLLVSSKASDGECQESELIVAQLACFVHSGLVGVIVKPTVGVLDFASTVTGARDDTKQFLNVLRNQTA